MMKYDTSFTIGVEQKALSKGFVLPIKIDFAKAPHLLLSAPSGAGKTYALKFILKQLSANNGIVYLCDYKGIDFINMQGCERYFKHQEVSKGLELVFNILQERMKKPKSENQPCYLVFDEYGGFLSSISNKQLKQQCMEQLSAILMLGRGAGVFIILTMQRADSSNFLSGARDNFGIALGLGRLSKESARMLFPDDTDLIQAKSRGKGYLRVDGKPLTEIVIPQIRNMLDVDNIIKISLSDTEKEGG